MIGSLASPHRPCMTFLYVASQVLAPASSPRSVALPQLLSPRAFSIGVVPCGKLCSLDSQTHTGDLHPINSRPCRAYQFAQPERRLGCETKTNIAERRPVSVVVRHSMNVLKTIYILLGLVLVSTVFFYLWLWFVTRRPGKWAAWVDRENDYWVRKGLISDTVAEAMKRIEKGRPLKVVIGAAALLGTGGLILAAYSLANLDLLS